MNRAIKRAIIAVGVAGVGALAAKIIVPKVKLHLYVKNDLDMDMYDFKAFGLKDRYDDIKRAEKDKASFEKDCRKLGITDSQRANMPQYQNLVRLEKEAHERFRNLKRTLDGSAMYDLKDDTVESEFEKQFSESQKARAKAKAEKTFEEKIEEAIPESPITAEEMNASLEAAVWPESKQMKATGELYKKCHLFLHLKDVNFEDPHLDLSNPPIGITLTLDGNTGLVNGVLEFAPTIDIEIGKVDLEKVKFAGGAECEVNKKTYPAKKGEKSEAEL